MASITYWNRLEPRARSTDLANALAARIRDPAWCLARQWQLGEFQGADAGSPAYLRISAQVAPMVAWSSTTATSATPLVPGAPLERVATAEGASPDDLALAVQLGQTFDRFLVDLAATDLRSAFLAAFPISQTPPAGGDDPVAARLRALWTGRAIDGLALYFASQATPSTAMPSTITAARQSVASTAIAQLATWVASVVGPISAADPVAWQPDQLNYAVRVFAGTPAPPPPATVPTAIAATPTSPTLPVIALAGAPDRRADLAWYAFDADTAAPPSGIAAPPATLIKRAVIPGPVRFRGMPNERFWDFEDNRVDFGALTPDQRGLASLIVMDFMLVHGNDWFLVPFELPLGSLCATELTMVDVFGESTAIGRADATPAGAPPLARTWTMFSTASANGPTSYFTLPASAAGLSIDGSALEEVRFLRDDTASVAWGVEHATEGSLGVARAASNRTATALPAPSSSSSALVYQLASSVPPNWIPFQPVKASTGAEVALERSALLSLTGSPSLPAPLGRILEPTSLAGAPYRIREEQLPREGVQLVRRARRARGTDGTTHVWINRARSVGSGEGWSGLRFDLAVAAKE